MIWLSSIANPIIFKIIQSSEVVEWVKKILDKVKIKKKRLKEITTLTKWTSVKKWAQSFIFLKEFDQLRN